MERITGTPEISTRARRLAAAFAAVALASTLASAAPAAANAAERPYFSPHGHCDSQNVAVALAPGEARDQIIHTVYCQPKRWAPGKHQVDELTAGATYDHRYWMWPQNPKKYSYADKTLVAGRAVLAYDRLGSGQSSHPLSSKITVESDAYILHQLTDRLHKRGLKIVNSIGHSYGSGIALHEAATYNDVSRLVLTGYYHLPIPTNPAVTAGIYPANQDPAFAGRNLDSGYYTTRPGARETSFYSSSAKQNVIARDEARKDLVSITGLSSFIAERNVPPAANISQRVKVPTLEILGNRDAIFCYDPPKFNCSDGALLQSNEKPYFTGAPSFQARAINNTGHNLTLHPSADESFRKINRWIGIHSIKG